MVKTTIMLSEDDNHDSHCHHVRDDDNGDGDEDEDSDNDVH